MKKNIKKMMEKANYWATPLYDSLPRWVFPDRRLRFKAYCVGMVKTGTVSMHVIFSGEYRSAHEAEHRFLANKIRAFANKKISESELISYVKRRDKRLSLEMDSSGLNYYLIDILVSEFPEAKFILTIRDCYSWLDSLINHYLARPMLRDKHWSKKWVVELDNIRFKADQFRQHAKEEKVLADNGLHTLDGYFSYWAEHNSKVLATVPPERLLVVKTWEINRKLPQIELFLELPTGSLPNQVRQNVGTKKFDLLSKIDRVFLEEKANFHCKPLMDKYFPELKGFRQNKKKPK